jgi:LPS O-antigen subunit length determinant protein (WzzB/FepE family)
MKITLDDVDLYTVSDVQQKIIQNDVNTDRFEATIKNQLQGVLKSQYDLSFRNLKQKWDPILAQRVTSVPTDPTAYAALVFQQPDYLDRKGRDTAAKAAQDALNQPKP